MRIFCPAIKQRPYFVVLTTGLGLLGEEIRPAPTLLAPTHAVGRVAHLIKRATYRTRAGRCLEVAPGGPGRTGSPGSAQTHNHCPLPCEQLRRTCSVVNVRAPAIPPEQPNYLDRESGDAPNRVRGWPLW